MLSLSVFIVQALVLFFCEQVFVLVSKGSTLGLMTGAVYAVIFLVMGIAGIGVVWMLGSCFSKHFTLRPALCIGFAYLFVTAGRMIWPNHLGTYGLLGLSKNLVLLLYCLVVFILIAQWSKRGLLCGFRRWVVCMVLFMAAIGWAVCFPDKYLADEPFNYWATALFLALLLGLLYYVRLGLSVPVLVDLGFIGCLLLVVFAINMGGGRLIADQWWQTPLSVRGRSDLHEAGKQPNIIFIVWDTVRKDHLSVYGYHRSTTPNLENLARQSMVYTNAVSVAPWTVPSHATMFTGLYPREHGAHHRSHPQTQVDYNELPEETVTLAEYLGRRGYLTAGIAANGLAGPLANLDQGFDYFLFQMNPRYLNPGHFDFCKYITNILTPWVFTRFSFGFLQPYLTAEQVNARALSWIDAIPRNQPFLLYLNYIDAHTPYFPPEYLRYRFPGFQRQLMYTDPGAIQEEMVEQNRPLSERERLHMISQYDAILVYLDEQLKVFEDELRRRGLFDDALIFLVSDHGEWFGEHNLLTHSKDLYSQVLNIPFIIKYPHGTPSGVNASLTSNRAVFDLILQAVGLERPKEAHPWQAIAEWYGNRQHKKLKNGTPFFYHARDRHAAYYGQFKYIASSDGADELYNLAADPGESLNLIHDEIDIAVQGRHIMEQFFNTVPARQPSEISELLNQEQADALRALGYIQ